MKRPARVGQSRSQTIWHILTLKNARGAENARKNARRRSYTYVKNAFAAGSEESAGPGAFVSDLFCDWEKIFVQSVSKCPCHRVSLSRMRDDTGCIFNPKGEFRGSMASESLFLCCGDTCRDVCRTEIYQEEGCQVPWKISRCCCGGNAFILYLPHAARFSGRTSHELL